MRHSLLLEFPLDWQGLSPTNKELKPSEFRFACTSDFFQCPLLGVVFFVFW